MPQIIPLDNTEYELSIEYKVEAFPSCCGLGIIHDFIPRMVHKKDKSGWHPAFPSASRLTEDDRKRIVDWFRRELMNIGHDEQWSRLTFTDSDNKASCVSLRWLGDQLECDKSHTFYNPNSGNYVSCFFFETHYEDDEGSEDDDDDWD